MGTMSEMMSAYDTYDAPRVDHREVAMEAAKAAIVERRRADAWMDYERGLRNLEAAQLGAQKWAARAAVSKKETRIREQALQEPAVQRRLVDMHISGLAAEGLIP